MLPTIVHLDADAFFVSVELALAPHLRGKKVAVGGRERGIIASASYEARAAGVYTPMPTARALKICPDLILLPHKGSYSGTSRRMFDLCENLTPLVQRNSIDEGYLDITPCGHKTIAEIETAVRALQTRIWQQLQIPVSIGIATNKLVSQIASKLRKPRGFVTVPPGQEAAFLAPLPVGKLPGIGAKTEPILNAAGIRTVSDLLAKTDTQLEQIFGAQFREVRQAALGRDDSPVHTEHEDPKSYSQQTTFPRDISDPAQIERILKQMLDELLPQIRADKKFARTLTVRVRHPDFTDKSAARSLPVSTDLETHFYPLIPQLLRQIWPHRTPLRLVGLKLSNIDTGAQQQLEIFTHNADEKRRQLAAALDQLNQRKTGAPIRRAHQL